MDLCYYRQEIDKNIKGLYVNINRLLKHYIDKYEIISFSFSVFSNLLQNGKCMIGNLSLFWNLDGGNMSSLCKKMGQKSWIKGEQSEEDERIVGVSLVEDLKLRIQMVNNKMDQKYKAFIKHFDTQQLDVSIYELQDMNQYLEYQVISGEREDI